jgi:hypothetical protein
MDGRIFGPRVIDGMMLGELAAHASVERRFVRVGRALAATFFMMIECSFLAVTSATWNDRALPW